MCERVPKLLSALVLPCFLMCGYHHCTVAITVNSSEATTNDDLMPSEHGLGRSLALCFTHDEKLKCFEELVVQALDVAIASNSTWHFSDFLAIEKAQAVIGNNASYSYWKLLQQQQQQQRQQPQPQHPRQARSFGDTIGEKLIQLAEARSVRLQMPRPESPSVHLMHLGGQATSITNGISDAIDEITSAVSLTSLADINHAAEEGRRKKDKDKSMATIGGMAMMAMMVQMFLGKVILIAGAAFVMAKIALVVAVLGSLKKGSVGSSGGAEHLILTSGGGGHIHDSGWHRSMPYDAHPHVEAYSANHFPPPPIHSAPPPAHYGSSMPGHHLYQNGDTSGGEHGAEEEAEGSEFKRRRNNIAGFL